MHTRLTRIVLALIAVSTVVGCNGQKFQTLKDAVCCDGGFEYRYGDRFAAEKSSSDRFAALERDRQRLNDELAAARKENEVLSAKSRSLEDQLADRDRELTSSRAKTESVQGDLNRANARSADLERQLGEAQGSLASSQSQISALQAGAADSGTLAAELAAAQV